MSMVMRCKLEKKLLGCLIDKMCGQITNNYLQLHATDCAETAAFGKQLELCRMAN